MFQVAKLAAFALTASSVSALVVPRAAPPAGWSTDYLEVMPFCPLLPSSTETFSMQDYDVYHTRYLALGCQDKHGTEFFDLCCHPLLVRLHAYDSRCLNEHNLFHRLGNPFQVALHNATPLSPLRPNPLKFQKKEIAMKMTTMSQLLPPKLCRGSPHLRLRLSLRRPPPTRYRMVPRRSRHRQVWQLGQLTLVDCRLFDTCSEYRILKVSFHQCNLLLSERHCRRLWQGPWRRRDDCCHRYVQPSTRTWVAYPRCRWRSVWQFGSRFFRVR